MKVKNGNGKRHATQQSVNSAVKAICDIMRRSNCARACNSDSWSEFSTSTQNGDSARKGTRICEKCLATRLNANCPIISNPVRPEPSSRWAIPRKRTASSTDGTAAHAVSVAEGIG